MAALAHLEISTTDMQCRTRRPSTDTNIAVGDDKPTLRCVCTDTYITRIDPLNINSCRSTSGSEDEIRIRTQHHIIRSGICRHIPRVNLAQETILITAPLELDERIKICAGSADQMKSAAGRPCPDTHIA